jgi:hypothetical protein
VSEVVDLQVYSLLARLNQDQDVACRKLRDAAAAQAAQLAAEARSRARLRLKAAVLEKRRRVEEHCRKVRVKLETRRREEQFAELGKRLADGLAMLPGALAERWANEESRHGWCQMVLDGAASAMRRGAWRMEIAPGLSPAERTELASRAAALAGSEVDMEEIEALQAGLAVVHDGVRFDGTIAGLLANGTRVQAALLAELGAGDRSQ